MIEVKLPAMGSDMEEGKLLEWKVKPGDAVKRGDVVAVVDTTKAAVDVESWDAGTLHEQLVAVGQTVPVGTVIATMLAPGESAPAPGARPAAPAPAPAPTPGAPAPAPTPAAPAPSRKPVSPAARARAKELAVDVDKIAGTGPQGAVTVEDVEKVVSAAMPAVAAKPADRASEMRRAIGAAMGRSKREIPHYYLAETIPMARAAEWLALENAKRPVTERLLMGVLQLKAVALALERAPELNGFWRDGAFQPSSARHLGVAISLREGGLIAPALHDVDRKSLGEIMRELSDLVTRARAGSLRSSEMSDPTITVTNLGESGVEAVYGVIYPPQVALVGFGRVAPRPWVEGESVRAIPLVTASLSADHRASDGMRGARFLAALRERLQHPEEL
jgi:pyruvate dehydrogenase E2 component (dihydrolipoamide acetyltransferase)